MAPAKASTRRRAASKPAEEAPVQQAGPVPGYHLPPGHQWPGPAYPYHPYPQQQGGGGWKLVVIVLLVAAVAWMFMQQQVRIVPDDRPHPDGGGSASQLVRDLDAAMQGPHAKKHARFLGIVASDVGNRLGVDALAESPIFDQKAEVDTLTAHAGQISVLGTPLAHYAGLPGVIEKHMSQLGEDGGELTPEDRNKAVRLWRELSAAFKEVGQ